MFPVEPTLSKKTPQGSSLIPRHAVVLAGGVEPRAESLLPLLGPVDLAVAADGGYRLAQRIGLSCQRLVGDFDTLTPAEILAAEAAGVPIERHPPDKDQSDLELALAAVHRLGAQRVTIVGALGGEWDHCAVNLVAPLSYCLELGMWGRLLTAEAQLYLSESSATVRAPGQRLSLVSLSHQVEGLTLQGFTYPLESAGLKRSQTLGLANQVTSQHASIEFSAGELLIILMNG